MNNQHIKTRVSIETKEKIENYCKENEMSVSGFLRLAIKSFFEKKKGKQI